MSENLNGGAGVVLVALALLAATCRPARADTKTLVCTNNNAAGQSTFSDRKISMRPLPAL